MSRQISLLPWAFALLAAALGCAEAEHAANEDEALAIEEVGGPIDAELSTEDDPRGRRRSESRQVLPPGFPADLPLPTGVRITEGNPREARNVVLFDSEAGAENLAVDWAALLETGGWSVERAGALSLVATRGDRSIAASVTRTGSGSRLRIEY